jgi:hypothetical protein
MEVPLAAEQLDAGNPTKQVSSAEMSQAVPVALPLDEPALPDELVPVLVPLEVPLLEALASHCVSHLEVRHESKFVEAVSHAIVSFDAQFVTHVVSLHAQAAMHVMNGPQAPPLRSRLA